MKYLFAVSAPVFALLSVACTGIFDGPAPSDRTSTDPSMNQPTNNGTGGSSASGGSGGTTATTDSGPPFKVRNTEPELVPFDMRLRRIASAIGVQADNPMFATMNKNSLKLGDYDYANGALPDSSWNANRISAWITALKPVCNSPEMKAKYPALPENLPQLIRAAWGHVPSAQDTADFTEAIAAGSNDPAVVYESTCMAVFTAAEFVYR